MTRYPPQCLGQNSDSPQLTFASLDALGPCMIKLRVAGISAVLEPSTAASAAAEYAGFLGSPALWACGTDHC